MKKAAFWSVVLAASLIGIQVNAQINLNVPQDTDESNLPMCKGDNLKSWNGCQRTVGFDDGSTYAGEWQNGEPNGKGKLKTRKFKYVGEFLNGKPHGSGTLKSSDGKYVGEFLNGKYHGWGSVKLSNGQEVAGLFENGEFKKQMSKQEAAAVKSKQLADEKAKQIAEAARAKQLAELKAAEEATARNAGFKDVSTYNQAKEGGFSTEEEMRKVRSLGFWTKFEYQEAQKAGFKNGEDFSKAKAAGFSSYKEMQKVTSLGFKKKADYLDAQKIGAANFAEYSDRKKAQREADERLKKAQREADERLGKVAAVYQNYILAELCSPYVSMNKLKTLSSKLVDQIIDGSIPKTDLGAFKDRAYEKGGRDVLQDPSYTMTLSLLNTPGVTRQQKVQFCSRPVNSIAESYETMIRNSAPQKEKKRAF